MEHVADRNDRGCGGLIAACCVAGHPTRCGCPHGRERFASRFSCLSPGVSHRDPQSGGDGSRGTSRPARWAPVFLGEKDTQAPRDGAASDRVTRHLAAWLTAFDCCTIFAPWHDPRADHEGAALIGEAAAGVTNARLAAYPVWGWTLLPNGTVQDHIIGSVAGGRRLQRTWPPSVARSRPMPRNMARSSVMIRQDFGCHPISWPSSIDRGRPFCCHD